MTFDWQYMVDVLPYYKTALWLTIKLASIGIVFAIIVGMICSVIQYFKVKVITNIVQIYLEIARNTDHSHSRMVICCILHSSGKLWLEFKL